MSENFFVEFLKEKERQEALQRAYKIEDEEVKKESQAVPWIPFVNALTFEKKDIIRNSEMVEKRISDFGKNVFMILRAFSMSPDNILYANEMNVRYNLPPLLVHDYFLHKLPKKKSFAKWPKKDTSNDDIIKAVKVYFNCSTKDAERYIPLLKEQDLKKIKDVVDTMTP